MDIYQNNYDCLKTHYPHLAARLDALPAKDCIKIGTAKDGGMAYCLQRDGKIIPITDPVAPLATIQKQVDSLSREIQNFTRPVFIVGLHPGNELISIFNHCEKDTTPHCPQPLWVCIDSCISLYGFMNTWDITAILSSERVRFFWHEESEALAQWLEQHPEFPHLFTLISGAPESTLDLVMPPFATLIQQREQSTELLKEENNTYYNSISDEALSAVVSGNGARPPRLLMPTCSWSTFIQHSTRDTCKEFRDMGWDVCEMRIDAMLTPYHLVKTINEFKPDVFLFIDHMRYEAEDVYPRNMMYITWIQDEMDHLFCAKAGESITRYAQQGKRDLVIGYTTQDLTRRYGYPEDRLVSLKIKADPHIFHPVTLTPQQENRYGCELAFMTNASMPTEQIVEEKIIPIVSDWGINAQTVRDIHDHLWCAYRAGQTFCNREFFLQELNQFDGFQQAYQQLAAEEEETKLLRLFYWKLNDSIYRHVVIEWAEELGLDLHLYGHGWENHPRFKKFAHGVLAHGPELNLAYQAAGHNLHLNITQGMHQRVWEIIATKATPLFRKREPISYPEPPIRVMRQWVKHFEQGTRRTALPFPENDANTNDWLFRVAYNLTQQDNTLSETEIEKRILEKVEAIVTSRPDIMIDSFEHLSFGSKEQLAQILSRV